VTINNTAKALSQWVNLNQRGWLALGEADGCDMFGFPLVTHWLRVWAAEYRQILTQS
jgi:hypothetical protein